jgi:predicted dehydrogenase
MEKVRWGIIGCGDVCEVKSGPAFYKSANSELVAVMRRDAKKAEDYARRHNVRKWYSDASELINDDEIDIVYIATPPNTHKEYAIKVMQAGKPVYVEKPMALSYEECMDMIRVSNETGQKIFPAFYRRALPYFLKVKEIIDNGMIGEIIKVDICHYRVPELSDSNHNNLSWRVDKNIGGEGGYFYDMAPHAIDIMDYILGEIVEVKSFSGNFGQLYDVKDTISAVFLFKSGVVGCMNYCFVVSKSSEDEYVRVIGKEGEMKFNIFAFNPIELSNKQGRVIFEIPRPLHIQQPLIETIIAELRGSGACPSYAESAARTSRIMELAVSS